MAAETKTCANCTQRFTIEPDDFAFYEKLYVPAPTWCPTCRLIRRLAFTNDRALYKRACGMCGKSTMTGHAPDKEITVYCNPCWWSDRWDALEYGQAYDPTRPFFEQVKEIIRKTPMMALDSNYPTLINSEYVNHCATAKNCYLIFTADECENVLYSEYLLHNKDSMDSTILERGELCYETINCGNSYRVLFSEDCDSCRSVYFSKDCIGCSDCFGCVGLRSKQYHIFNEPHSKEAYAAKLKSFRLHSYESIEKLKEEARAFWLTYPRKSAHTLRNANTTGDYVYGAKNCKNMYIVSEGAEDSRYCQLMTMGGVKDCYDYTIWGNGAQRIYEGFIVGEGADTVTCSFQAWPNVRNIEYGFFTISSSYLFGCANIRNKQFCILNKQYTEEEWNALREKIIADMNERPYVDKKGRVYKYGEFFPPDLALAGYNESYAMDYFPLTKEAAEERGFTWYTPQPNPHKPTISAKDIPDSIHDTPDIILKEIIECESCHAPFRVVPSELALLKRFEAPVPHKCPNCRYRERRNRVNPPLLYHRRCQCAGQQSAEREARSATGESLSANRQALSDTRPAPSSVYPNTAQHFHGDAHCPNEFETSYAPDRPEIVYCESCYQAEVA